MKQFIFIFAVASLLLMPLFTPHTSAQKPSDKNYSEWRRFGGASDNIHYSTLSQINRSNVDKLEVAWTFDTGDAFRGSEMQCNPIIIDGMMYATTPKVRVIALYAATGKLLWSFDPNGEKA